MVDQTTKKIIDMIDTRDVNEVSVWLKSYSNLKLISRDGSIPYKTAIEITDTQIAQVSDRFHLLKGLSEAICNEINKIMPSSYVVEQLNIDIKEKMSLKERFLNTKRDIENGSTISKACIDNEINWRTFNKINLFTEKEFKEYFSENKKSKVELLSIERRHRKKELIEKANSLFESGMSERKIVMALNIDRRTLIKYLDPDYSSNLISQSKTKKSRSELDGYKETICEMLFHNATQKNIFLKIKQLGYKGSYSNLRMFIRHQKMKNRLFLDITVNRSDIKAIIFHKRDENILSREHLNKVFKEFPKLKKVLEIFFEFKDILLNHKFKDRLNKWINKNGAYTYVNTFVNGINRDLDAVYNSLIYNFSNGIIESKVNTAKLSKRKMYGRCSFQLLRNKVLLMEKFYQ